MTSRNKAQYETGEYDFIESGEDHGSFEDFPDLLVDGNERYFEPDSNMNEESSHRNWDYRFEPESFGLEKSPLGFSSDTFSQSSQPNIGYDDDILEFDGLPNSTDKIDKLKKNRDTGGDNLLYNDQSILRESSPQNFRYNQNSGDDFSDHIKFDVKPYTNDSQEGVLSRSKNIQDNLHISTQYSDLKSSNNEFSFGDSSRNGRIFSEEALSGINADQFSKNSSNQSMSNDIMSGDSEDDDHSQLTDSQSENSPENDGFPKYSSARNHSSKDTLPRAPVSPISSHQESESFFTDDSFGRRQLHRPLGSVPPPSPSIANQRSIQATIETLTSKISQLENERDGSQAKIQELQDTINSYQKRMSEGREHQRNFDKVKQAENHMEQIHQQRMRNDGTDSGLGSIASGGPNGGSIGTGIGNFNRETGEVLQDSVETLFSENMKLEAQLANLRERNQALERLAEGTKFYARRLNDEREEAMRAYTNARDEIDMIKEELNELRTTAEMMKYRKNLQTKGGYRGVIVETPPSEDDEQQDNSSVNHSSDDMEIASLHKRSTVAAQTNQFDDSFFLPDHSGLETDRMHKQKSSMTSPGNEHLPQAKSKSHDGHVGDEGSIGDSEDIMNDSFKSFIDPEEISQLQAEVRDQEKRRLKKERERIVAYSALKRQREFLEKKVKQTEQEHSFPEHRHHDIDPKVLHDILLSKKNNRRTDPEWRRVALSQGHLKRPILSNAKHMTNSKIDPIGLGRELPFLPGGNTNKSYSLTANLQRVYAMLKAHEPKICTICRRKDKLSHLRPPYINHDKVKDDYLNEELDRIMVVMEDELKHLKMHYHKLAQEYDRINPAFAKSAHDEKSHRNAVAEELKELLENMELKADQLAALQDWHANGKNSRQKMVNTASSSSRKVTTKPPRRQRDTRNEKLESLGLFKSSRKIADILGTLYRS